MKKLLFVLLLALGPVFQPTAMAATTETISPNDFLTQHKDFMGEIHIMAYWTNESGQVITRLTVTGYSTIHFEGEFAYVVVNIPDGPYKCYFDLKIHADEVYVTLVQGAQEIAGEGSHVAIVFGPNYIK